MQIDHVDRMIEDLDNEIAGMPEGALKEKKREMVRELYLKAEQMKALDELLKLHQRAEEATQKVMDVLRGGLDDQ